MHKNAADAVVVIEPIPRRYSFLCNLFIQHFVVLQLLHEIITSNCCQYNTIQCNIIQFIFHMKHLNGEVTQW